MVRSNSGAPSKDSAIFKAAVERERAVTESIRSLDLSRVAEDFLGLVPKESTKSHRIYDVNGTLLNLNLREQAWGVLNEVRLTCLGNKGGSRCNAIDLVRGVRELQGSPESFKDSKEALRVWACIPSHLRPTPKAPPPPAAKPKEEFSDEPCKSLPHVRESLWPEVRAFLVERRGLDPALVDALNARMLIYPTLQEPVQGSKARPSPAVVFLSVSPRNGNPVSFQTKPLPRGTYKPKGLSGPEIGRGVFLLGEFGPHTKTVVVCEGPIDAIAYLQLYGGDLPPETAVAATFGVRIPEALMEAAANGKWNTEFVFAFDADPPGRRGTAKALNAAKERGIPARSHEMKDTQWSIDVYHADAEEFAADLITEAEKQMTAAGVPFERTQIDQDTTSFRVTASDAALAALDRIEAFARPLREKVYARRLLEEGQREMERRGISAPRVVTIEGDGDSRAIVINNKEAAQATAKLKDSLVQGLRKAHLSYRIEPSQDESIVIRVNALKDPQQIVAIVDQCAAPARNAAAERIQKDLGREAATRYEMPSPKPLKTRTDLKDWNDLLLSMRPAQQPQQNAKAPVRARLPVRLHEPTSSWVAEGSRHWFRLKVPEEKREEFMDAVMHGLPGVEVEYSAGIYKVVEEGFESLGIERLTEAPQFDHPAQDNGSSEHHHSAQDKPDEHLPSVDSSQREDPRLS